MSRARVTTRDAFGRDPTSLSVACLLEGELICATATNNTHIVLYTGTRISAVQLCDKPSAAHWLLCITCSHLSQPIPLCHRTKQLSTPESGLHLFDNLHVSYACCLTDSLLALTFIADSTQLS